MNYWLVKSDPETYGWDELLKDGTTRWDGIRSYAARNHLKGMKKGDKVLFYHSQTNPGVVGIAKVAKEYYQDPTTDEDAWVCVDLSADKPLKKSVTLPQIKREKRLKNMLLLKIGRLSVMPVTKDEFDVVVELGSK
jgi:predicted RNA-binding protein with PUA-like domain